MKEKISFLMKVTIAHVVTYFICGMFFYKLFDYKDLSEQKVFGDFMKDINGPGIYFGPLWQFIRGLLFGGILLLFPKEFFQKKLGWLKLWAVVAGIGIINTPGAAIGSIEGMIYANIQPEAYKGLVEVFVQTLLFSLWVCQKPGGNGYALFAKYKYPLIAAGIAAIGISVSGILLWLFFIDGIELTEGAKNPYAMLILLLSAIIAFTVTLWYTKKRDNPPPQTAVKKPVNRAFIFFPVCYVANGVLAVIYNYVADSKFKSPLPLLSAAVFTVLTWLIVRKKSRG
jgi:uncharacterized membrane protein